MSLIVLDICLSDIPQEAAKQGKNGKWYAKVCCADRREPDQYGNTHSLYMNQTQEERQANTPKQYVGSAKIVAEGGRTTQQQQGYAPAPQQQHGGWGPAPGGATQPQGGWGPAPQQQPSQQQQGWGPAQQQQQQPAQGFGQKPGSGSIPF